MEYRFLTVAGMDYEIDEEDYEPDTLLALNNFSITEAEFEDKDLLKSIFKHQMVVLGLKRFMDIGEYVFKSTSVIAISEALDKSDTVETEMIEFDKENILVGTDIESAERKRAIIPIVTKIKITFTKSPISDTYKLNVYQWTNDNDEDEEWEWRPLFWITLLSI